jgi:glycosyltransferase involved in cell wall biosynthesis
MVGPLPPVQTGPADYLANMLPGLARHAEISVFVPDPSAVELGLSRDYRVRPLSERRDPAVNRLVYHVANSVEQIPTIDAALEGPPGLLEIHDGSQHHLVARRFGDFDSLGKYAEILEAAHGPIGARLAELRRSGPGLQSELFIYDLLRPLLEHHQGVIAHNRWTADLVEMRSPGTPTWIVPHFAPQAPPVMPRSRIGLPEDRLLIGHFGYVTQPKRPHLLMRAFARLLQTGVNAHLVFGGAADPMLLAPEIESLHLKGRVTLTGYLSRRDMDHLINAVDIVVNLRFPHLGESSGVLAEAMAAGRPVIVHGVGGWADLPVDTVVRATLGEGELPGLVQALVQLANPELRARLGRAAQNYATTVLDLNRCAAAIVNAAEASVRQAPPIARDVMRERSAAVASWHASHPNGYRLATAIPPARPGAKLLNVGGTADVRESLASVWGYAVTAHDGPVSERGLPFPAGSFAAVTMGSADSLVDDDPMLSLVECNRVLLPGGLLLLAREPRVDKDIEEETLIRLLAAAGFSVDSVSAHAVAAHKAGLPIERYPEELYAARWLERLPA